MEERETNYYTTDKEQNQVLMKQNRNENVSNAMAQ